MSLVDHILCCLEHLGVFHGKISGRVVPGVSSTGGYSEHVVPEAAVLFTRRGGISGRSSGRVVSLSIGTSRIHAPFTAAEEAPVAEEAPAAEAAPAEEAPAAEEAAPAETEVTTEQPAEQVLKHFPG